MKLFFRQLWNRRVIRLIVWPLAAVATLYALLCAWANWAGARKWRAAQEQARAAGETLDFEKAALNPVPDEQNFFAIPLLRGLLLAEEKGAAGEEAGGNREKLKILSLPTGKERPARPDGAATGRRCDLSAWAAWLREQQPGASQPPSGLAPAQAILASLAKQDSIIAGLAAGADRPHSRWTPAWKTRDLPRPLFAVKMPHISPSQQMGQALALHGIAAARAGDFERAGTALRIAARLCEADLSEPFLIGQLVAASNSTSLAHAVWELCDSQAASAAVFAKLEQALSIIDFKQGALNGCRGEMAAGADAIQWMKETRDPAFFSIISQGGASPSDRGWSLIALLIPRGLLDANAAVLSDLYLKHLIAPLKDSGCDWAGVLASSEQCMSQVKEAKARTFSNLDHVMAALTLPAMGKLNEQLAYADCLMSQSVIACALERHRIEQGSYPESLAAVRFSSGKAPPADPMNGKPMGYRKTADGRYALWSIGIDGKDDGGQRTLDAKQPDKTRFSDAKYKGDWVWSYPPK